jgi:hypothetical protein
LQQIVNSLKTSAVAFDDGKAWYTPPQRLPDSQRKRNPEGYFNLGVAHGVPGVAQFLSDLIEAGAAPANTTELLHDCISWLLAKRRPVSSPTLFSSWYVPGEADSGDSRLGWCYGDLGITVVLDRIASQLGDTALAASVDELADRCARWPMERASIVDAGLCHGAIGVAHIFNVMSQRRVNPRCEQAAAYWYEYGLRLRRPGTGVAGYIAWRPDPSVPNGDASFLAGAVGIGLGLQAAISNVTPRWDQRLMLSNPAIDAWASERV